MRVNQIQIASTEALAAQLDAVADPAPNLLLVFADLHLLRAVAPLLQERFPHAVRVGCSTAGEITDDGVFDGTAVVTALHFDAGSRVVEAVTTLDGMADSQDAGRRLAAQLPREGLRAVWVLGQGVAINGSGLIAGLAEILGGDIPITGGLAGDGGAFQQTWVLSSKGCTDSDVVCLGLYGPQLSVSHGSCGGWSPFGVARKVTLCDHNVLFELDHEPALAVYKRYLGEHAAGLPASGLLFPFAMLGEDHKETGLIRTILGVDENAGSLTLAGDISAGGYLRLMHASTDALVEGAEAAAADAKLHWDGSGQSLSVLVSCVGRKLVMGGRVDEEVEAVVDALDRPAATTGFYSYGEISPYAGSTDCKLHNQTMTITQIAENAA